MNKKIIVAMFIILVVGIILGGCLVFFIIKDKNTKAGSNDNTTPSTTTTTTTAAISSADLEEAKNITKTMLDNYLKTGLTGYGFCLMEDLDEGSIIETDEALFYKMKNYKTVEEVKKSLSETLTDEMVNKVVKVNLVTKNNTLYCKTPYGSYPFYNDNVIIDSIEATDTKIKATIGYSKGDDEVHGHDYYQANVELTKVDNKWKIASFDTKLVKHD
ncbi:MAG: hypothetical protein K5666_04495 [Bacilli bacterium]|nr:hypothetical protein [Bacilli bacterium]